MSFEELNSLYPVKALLSILNLQRITENSEYFKFSSPFREDKNPSMILYKKNLFCIDFASGYKASIFKFVKDLTGSNFYDFTEIDRTSISSNAFSSSLKSYKKEFPLRKKSVKLIGKKYSVFDSPLAMDYCKSRFISDRFIKEFQLFYSKNMHVNTTFFKDRLCIPVFEKGKMVSVEGRDVTRKQNTKVLYPKGGSVSTLFNIDNLDKNKELVIVEGIMDMPKIWENITKNVTTTFGIMITNKQKELLNQFPNIVLFPDGDEAGQRMISEFDKFYEYEFKIAFLSDTDPGDADLDSIIKVLENPQRSSEYFLDKYDLFPEKTYNFF